MRIEDSDEGADAPTAQYAEALAAMGLQAEGGLDVEDVFELWPDNQKTFHFWRSVQTQWRYSGMGVATGLDYQGIRVCMHMHGIPKNEQATLFLELQVMESATLNEWNSQRK